MLKQSINGFRINVRGLDYGEKSTPLSVIGCLSSCGAIKDPYFGVNARDIGEILSEGCTLESVFRVDSVAYAQRRVMLSLHRVDYPCSVQINGTKVFECDGRAADYLFDVKKYLSVGENTLSFSFSGESVIASSIPDRLSSIAIGKCELVCFNDDIITEVGAKKEMCDGFVRLTVMVSTLESSAAVRAVATIVSPGGSIYYCGISGGTGYVDIYEPNLWWPNSYGVQNLYKLTVNLYSDDEITDSVDMRLGLADVKLLPWDKEGVPTVTVNAVPIFTRGAAYVSDDLLLPYLDPTRVKKNLTALKEMGANTVVLRDIGVFPDDGFFKLCDELGLIVWTEMRSADEGLLRHKLEDNVRKVIHHASFGPIICRNSEILSIVNEVLPSVAAEQVEEIEKLFVKSLTSVPHVRTLLSVTPPDELNIFSKELQYRTTLRDNISLIDSKNFRFPVGMHDVHCVTSYSECLSLKETVEWKRRERKSDLGVILPRFNDPCPMISESVIDYYGRKKPQFYLLRSLFSPIMISAYNDGTRVTFSVSNEMKNEYSGRFSCYVFTNRGEELFHEDFDVTVAEREAMEVLTADLEEKIAGRLDECFVTCSITDGYITASKGTLLFTSPKEFKFIKPNFTADISGSGTKFVLSVSSDVPVDKVHFEFESVDAVFEDNFIFIDDSSARTIAFTTSAATAIELLRRELKIRSIYDVGRNN